VDFFASWVQEKTFFLPSINQVHYYLKKNYRIVIGETFLVPQKKLLESYHTLLL